MKHIYVNLKRFDVPEELGGVNRLAAIQDWPDAIIKKVAKELRAYDSGVVDFTIFFPEAHLVRAVAVAKETNAPLVIGCQGVYREDVAPGGNFGAFTTGRPAAAASGLGCGAVLIGHCEERRAFAGVLQAAGSTELSAINRIMNEEVLCALGRDMRVLYCIGETSEEQDDWENVLRRQLVDGLKGADRERVVIAYEPVWAIGPGKTPPDAEYIAKIARFVKKETDGMDLVYGGGLKLDNAAMLAGIREMSGGLIALTRFSGEIGFYPEEYLAIVKAYMQGLPEE